MTDNAAFRTALVRLGCNQPTTKVIIAHGLTDFNHLVVAKQFSTIMDLVKTVVASGGPPDAEGVAAPTAPQATIMRNVIAEAHLSAIVYWVQQEHSLGRVFTSVLVTAQLARDYMVIQEENAWRDKLQATALTSSPEFKVDADWPRYEASVKVELQATRGLAFAVLSYVIRPGVSSAPYDADCDTIDEKRILMTLHGISNF